MENAKKTPLFNKHLESHGKIINFGGWELPVQYTSLKEEHLNVRKNVGLFDVSHMGEIFFKGPKSLESLEWLTSNKVSFLEEGKAHYSLLTNFQGGIVDDIIIYCIKKNQEYLVCVNASNIEKDFEWMKKHNKSGAEILNLSSEYSQLAIQGPKSFDLLDQIFSVLPKNPFEFIQTKYLNQNIFIAYTGYTGEKGVEVFMPNSVAEKMWDEILQKGKAFGIQPIGLGARDTLRLEMKYSLYGQEITDLTDPISSVLGWVVKLEKGDFIGRNEIQKVKEVGIQKKLVGFEVLDKPIPRTGYKLYSIDKNPIGIVTSGTLSPSLNKPIGIGYIDKKESDIGNEFLVEVREKYYKAKVVKTPFWQGVI